jgi:hypothetical protein
MNPYVKYVIASHFSFLEMFTARNTYLGLLQSRATGIYTLRRKFYVMGLIDSPLSRRCGSEELTFCVNVKL